MAKRSQEKTTGRIGLNLTLVFVAVVVAAILLPRAPGLQLHENAKADGPGAYPIAGAAFIRQNYPNARLFNSYNWGGYLVNELYPRKVFVYGRTDSYGDITLRDFLRVVYVQPDWQEVLGKYGFDLLIIDSPSTLSEMLDTTPNWQRVFTGPVEAVYERR